MRAREPAKSAADALARAAAGDLSHYVEAAATAVIGRRADRVSARGALEKDSMNETIRSTRSTALSARRACPAGDGVVAWQPANALGAADALGKLEEYVTDQKKEETSTT